jgi:hypothetical protein
MKRPSPWFCRTFRQIKIRGEWEWLATDHDFDSEQSAVVFARRHWCQLFERVGIEDVTGDGVCWDWHERFVNEWQDGEIQF